MADEDLIKAAIDARKRAYAPYSKFDVGAAIRDETGRIHRGQNVENAAYPNGICAETAAIAAMIDAGGRSITAIAVAGGDGSIMCTPCGGCRQRIREFASPDTPILIADDKGLMATFTLAALLPESFGPENLEPPGV